jgi:hypothetical protein
VPDAITNLRESGDIPWDAIVDETRSLTPAGPVSRLASTPYLNAVEPDPWHGAAPLITLRRTALSYSR